MPLTINRRQVPEYGAGPIDHDLRSGGFTYIPHVVNTPDVNGSKSFLELVHFFLSIFDEGPVERSRFVQL